MINTMRIIAYQHQSSDFCAARSALLQIEGVTACAMRNAGFWRDSTLPESGFDAVFAPEYPQIIKKYAEAGTPCFDKSIEPPKDPNELDALEQAPVVTILCPGKFVRQELGKRDVEGVVVVVNEAIHLYPKADYFIANDGFIKSLATAKTDAIRVCRKASKHTLPGGRWFAMDGIGITDGMFTTRCALRLAVNAIKCSKIVLMGHDCTVGVGTMTEFWNSGHVETLRNAVASDMYNMADKSGVTIEHIRWDEQKSAIQVDTYAPPSVLPSEPVTTKRTRKGSAK